MNLALLLAAMTLAILSASSRVNRKVQWIANVVLLLLLIVAPFITNSTSALFDALTAMCIAYGWNFIGGFAGYASFGNAAYLGLGAFVAAGFMSRQAGHLHMPWYAAIPLSMVIVALVAGAIGIAVLRLRGQYFSIATLGVFVAMPQLVNWDLFFGPHGLIPNFFGGGLPLNFPLAQDMTFFGRNFPADQFFFYYLGLATALLAFWLTATLVHRKFGYSLVAIRENEEAAEVMGINTTRSKAVAYMLSAALAALGGAVIGYKLTNMTTETEALFSTVNNLQMIIICLIGGIGTVWGPCIGAFALFSIEEMLKTFSGNNDVLQWQAVIFSGVIIVVVLLLPRGLMQFIRGSEKITLKTILKGLTEYRI